MIRIIQEHRLATTRYLRKFTKARINKNYGQVQNITVKHYQDPYTGEKIDGIEGIKSKNSSQLKDLS